MCSYLEDRVQSLEKMSLIDCVGTKWEIDHGEVDWLELSGLSTHEELADYRMRPVTSNNKVT